MGLDDLGGSSVITGVLIREGGRLENQRGAVGMEAEAGAVPLLALELEEGAAAQEALDKMRERFSPRTSRRNAAQLSLALAQPRDLWEVTQLLPVSVARL